jgi:hypothetical protein
MLLILAIGLFGRLGRVSTGAAQTFGAGFKFPFVFER